MKKRSAISQIQQNLLALISVTGISPNIVKNPAFKPIVQELSNDIGELGCPNIVDFRVEDTSFGFVYEWENKERAFFEVTAPYKNQLQCTYGLIKKRDFDTIHNKMWEKKEYTQYQIVAKEGLSVDKKVISFDNQYTENDALEVSLENVSFEFDKNGILLSRKYLQTGNVTEFINIDIIESKILAQIISQSLPGLLKVVNYEEKLKRRYIDVADLSLEDNINNRRFKGTVPLENAYSLQDMRVSKKTIDNEADILIKPLSKEMLMFMIFDQHPTYQEGLKKYCNGREGFVYNSSNDPEFINEKNSYPGFNF